MTNSRFLKLDEDLLKRVAENIPSEPWPQGLHKTIAAKLGISNGLASDAISHLLETGAVKKPFVETTNVTAGEVSGSRDSGANKNCDPGTAGPAK